MADPYANAANQYGQEMEFGTRLQDQLGQRMADQPNQLFDRFMQAYQMQVRQKMLEQQMAQQQAAEARRQQHEDTYLKMAQAKEINATSDDAYNQFSGDPQQRALYEGRFQALGVSPEQARTMLPKDTTMVPDQGPVVGQVGGVDIPMPQTSADIKTVPGMGGGYRQRIEEAARKLAADKAREEQAAAALSEKEAYGNKRFDQQLLMQQRSFEQQAKLLAQRQANVHVSVNGGGAAQSGLDPAALDIMANTFLKTGNIPVMFRGKEGEPIKRAIINRAAELGGGKVTDVASSASDFKANQASLTQMQKSYDAIVAFENTGLKNIDLMVQSAKALTDTGSPLLNKPLRELQSGIFGSSVVPTAKAARTVANNEIAKITTNPNLTGILTDEARKEVARYNPDNATLAQTIAVSNLLKRDMLNRKVSMEEQLQAIRGRIGAPVGGAPSSGPKVGDIEDGYEFLGGDPRDKTRWKKVR